MAVYDCRSFCRTLYAFYHIRRSGKGVGTRRGPESRPDIFMYADLLWDFAPAMFSDCKQKSVCLLSAGKNPASGAEKKAGKMVCVPVFLSGLFFLLSAFFSDVLSYMVQ
jgi:hypothetical protein